MNLARETQSSAAMVVPLEISFVNMLPDQSLKAAAQAQLTELAAVSFISSCRITVKPVEQTRPHPSPAVGVQIVVLTGPRMLRSSSTGSWRIRLAAAFCFSVQQDDLESAASLLQDGFRKIHAQLPPTARSRLRENALAKIRVACDHPMDCALPRVQLEAVAVRTL